MKQQIYLHYVPMDGLFAAIVGFPFAQNCGAQQEFSVSIKVSKEKLYHCNKLELGLITWEYDVKSDSIGLPGSASDKKIRLRNPDSM